MYKLDLAAIAQIPSQEHLKRCTGRRFLGKIIKSKDCITYVTKHDNGNTVYETYGTFMTNKE